MQKKIKGRQKPTRNYLVTYVYLTEFKFAFVLLSAVVVTVFNKKQLSGAVLPKTRPIKSSKFFKEIPIMKFFFYQRTCKFTKNRVLPKIFPSELLDELFCKRSVGLCLNSMQCHKNV